jgi:hypothetical protein
MKDLDYEKLLKEKASTGEPDQQTLDKLLVKVFKYINFKRPKTMLK